MKRKLFLICYDIRHPSRQRRVLKTIRGNAVDGQRSAYECQVTDAELASLVHSIAFEIDAREDQVGFLEIDSARKTRVAGKASPPQSPIYFYAG